MKYRWHWLKRSIVCFFKDHEDVVVFYDPVTGERDSGLVCARCGRPKIQTIKWFMWR